MASWVRKLKLSAPFLVYLYYDFDNRPGWFRSLWKVSDEARWLVARLPFPARKAVSVGLAASVYWPLTRIARLSERAGIDVANFPLRAYRHCSFYTMRTDALDRFGMRLEQRFSRAASEQMMTDSGLHDIVFREEVPYWVACGRKEA